MALGLTGCFLPTPVSVASMGADVVSFFFSGKTVADHGISVAMDEDCAMIGVLEGEICDDQPDYQDANIQVALAPLPSPFDSAALASADEQVRASAQRAALVFGGGVPAGSAPDAGFLADNVAPDGAVAGDRPTVDSLANVRPRSRPAEFDLIASAAETQVAMPLPTRRPDLQAAPEPVLAGGFLVDAAVVPGDDDVLVLQLASIAPAAGPAPDVAPAAEAEAPAAASPTAPERVVPAAGSQSNWKARRPNVKRAVIADARTVRPEPVKRVTRTSQRLTASRVTSEVGRAPLVQVAFELSHSDRQARTEPYTGPASLEMGR